MMQVFGQDGTRLHRVLLAALAIVACIGWYLPDEGPTLSRFARCQLLHGISPVSVRRPGIFAPRQWLARNPPVAPAVLFAKGVHYGMDEAPIVSAEAWLDPNCRLQGDDRYVRELGKEWKDRHSPQAAQPDWRIEVWRYSCALPSPAGTQIATASSGMR